MTSPKKSASSKVNKAARDLSVDQIESIILANSRYTAQFIQNIAGGEVDLGPAGRIAKSVTIRLKENPEKTDQRILSCEELAELSIDSESLKEKAVQFAKSIDPNVDKDKEAGPFLIDVCYAVLQGFTSVLMRNFKGLNELGSFRYYWTLVEEVLKISEKTGVAPADVPLVAQFNRQITKTLIPNRSQYAASLILAIAKPFDKSGFVDRVSQNLSPLILKFSKNNGLDPDEGTQLLKDLVSDISKGLIMGMEEQKAKLVSAYEKESDRIYGE